MGKNNSLINYYRRKSSEVTPRVYAGIAIALHRKYGWGYKRINGIFLESQRIWEENDVDILQLCAAETGIDLKYHSGGD